MFGKIRKKNGIQIQIDEWVKRAETEYLKTWDFFKFKLWKEFFFVLFVYKQVNRFLLCFLFFWLKYISNCWLGEKSQSKWNAFECWTSSRSWWWWCLWRGYSIRTTKIRMICLFKLTNQRKKEYSKAKEETFNKKKL